MGKIRLGMLGASRIADKAILPASKNCKGITVTAVAARERKKAESFAKRHGLMEIHDTYESMLASKSIDAVYISLPNHLHFIWGKRALEAGKHILIEKPITNSVKELAILQELARKKRLIVMEAFMYLYNDRFLKIQEIVQKGNIGKIRSIHADFSIPLSDPKDIRFLNEPGSGGLVDLGTYTNIFAEKVMAGWPEKVHCELTHFKPGHKADTRFTCLLAFSGGRTAVVSGGMQSQPTCEALVIGEKGSLMVHDFLWSGFEIPLLVKKGTPKWQELKIKTRNHYTLELEDFASSIRRGKEPFVSGKTSYNHRLVLDACLLSAKRGNPVIINSKEYKK